LRPFQYLIALSLPLTLFLTACGEVSQTITTTPPLVGSTFEIVAGSATSNDWRFPYTFTAFALLPYDSSTIPTSDVSVSVTGPEGWNGNRPLTFTVTKGEFTPEVVRLLPTIPLVSGMYKATALVNGKTYVSETLVDNSLTLQTTTVDFSLSGKSANLSWSEVASAKSYRAFLGASDINLRGERTLRLTSQFNLSFSPAEYTGRVLALNYNTTAKNLKRPLPQLMVSMSESAATVVPFTEGTFYQVDPAARYLQGDDNDTGKPATSLSLASLSAAPGECLGLMRVGDFVTDNSPLRPDASGDMIAVFQDGTNFLNPGMLGNQNAEYTSPTAQGKPVDIAEDFWVPGRLIKVQIPEGATQLLLSADDVYNSDNTDPDDDFGVRVAKVSCPVSKQLQSYEVNYLK
jgi:hypothetical protein